MKKVENSCFRRSKQPSQAIDFKLNIDNKNVNENQDNSYERTTSKYY